MSWRRLAAGLLAVTAAASVGALPAAAKEGVTATLTTRVPHDARAGTKLRVSWTLAYLDEKGRVHPFGANGVFVRLVSASGARARIGFAPMGEHSTGEYSATVVVPKGGIGRVQIGLRGTSDVFFPVRSPRGSGDRSAIWIGLIAAGALGALLLVALRMRPVSGWTPRPARRRYRTSSRSKASRFPS